MRVEKRTILNQEERGKLPNGDKCQTSAVLELYWAKKDKVYTGLQEVRSYNLAPNNVKEYKFWLKWQKGNGKRSVDPNYTYIRKGVLTW